MLKQFASDSAIYGGSALLVRGIGLVLVPFYTRVLVPADYGAIDLLSVFAAFVGVTVGLEIVQGLARHLADADTADARASLASTALWFTVSTYTFFLVVGLVALRPLSEIVLGDPDRTTVMAIALVSIWFNGLFYLLQSQLRWELKPRQYALASISYAFVSMAASILLVIGIRTGVSGVFMGQVAGAVVGLAVAVYHTRERLQRRFDRGQFAEMLRFSVPLIPSSLGVIVTSYIDRIAIRSLMDLSDVGLFGIGYRMASVASLVMIGFQASLTPLVYQRYREAGTPFELARIFRLFLVVALLLSLGLALFATEALQLLVPPEYLAGALVVPYLAPALLLSGMYVLAPGLAIAKRTSLTAAINLAGALMNTLLNYLLIPMLGIRGAAVATLLSATTVFGAYMITSQATYPVPHRWPQLAGATAITVGAYLLGSALHLPWWPGIVAKALLIGLVCVAFVAIGVVRKEELRSATSLMRSVLARRRT
jgi:O-antigen/teichoic acid export membrane protein